MEIIDEWDVESQTIPGLIFHVVVEEAPEFSPYDDYHRGTVYGEPESIAAWKLGDWQFVYTEVTPEYMGALLPEAANGIGGTEWGQFPGAEYKSDREYFTNVHPLPDYILPEVMSNLRDLSQPDVLRANIRTAKRRAWRSVMTARNDARNLKRLRKLL